MVNGLTENENAIFDELQETARDNLLKNLQKEKYYEGHVTLNDVNLGIALPDGLARLEVGCDWGAAAVDVLASRSMFDGFVSKNGMSAEDENRVVEENNLLAQYMRAVKDELKFGCSFFTLYEENGKAKIRVHSPLTASARWNGEKNRIDAGFSVVQTDEKGRAEIINFFTDYATFRLTRNGDGWSAEKLPNKQGVPLIVPLVWSPTSTKPFGRSRLKKTVRNLIDAHVRTVANATIGLEFSTTPQKYLLGVTDEQFDKVVNQKFRQYVGTILAATTNPETGTNPQFGQLPQGSIQPHVEMMRLLATQFSAVTGLSVTDTGVINDANPTSADAILAQSQKLVCLAQELNEGNGAALRTLLSLALAIERGTPFELTEAIAHFKNPAMPSVSATADAAIKIASARKAFAETDTFLEMIGFSQAEVRRIKAQEQNARGLSVIEDLENER